MRLPNAFLNVLKQWKIKRPTAIQMQAIPCALKI